MSIISIIVGTLIGALFSGLIIYLIGRMGWGIEVDGFRPAYLAAIIIAVLSALTQFLWSLIGFESDLTGIYGAILNAVYTALFLQFAGNRLQGLRVHGFSGALIAAVIMGAIVYLLGLLVSLVL